MAPPGTIVVIHNRPNDCASWEPHGEYGWYILSAIEHCRCHKVYIPKTRAERISDTVEFPPKIFSMPQMSFIDSTYHAAKDLIYALQNPAPASPLVKFRHEHKEILKTLDNIFRKTNLPAVSLRVPVREVSKKKTPRNELGINPNEKYTAINPVTNEEPLRVPILEAYIDEIQPVNQAKTRFFFKANHKP